MSEFTDLSASAVCELDDATAIDMTQLNLDADGILREDEEADTCLGDIPGDGDGALVAPEEVLPTITEEEEEDNFVMSALLCASEEGNITGLQELLENSPNFDLNQANKHGETAVHMAASGGHVEVMKMLKEKGVDLTIADRHGDTAVYWAARQGHVQVISYLKEQGVCLNTQNKSGEAAMHVAARYGHLDVLTFLCSSGADVNLQDRLGETVLHTAAWHGLPAQVCAQLCTAGSKVDTRNKDDETPLHCAAARGNIECIKVLLSHGASLNVVDRKGQTPLHLACQRRHIPISLILIHSGCNMDLLDANEESPLHSACREGLLPVVQTMCAFGCQVDFINKAGLTALHLGAKMGHTEVVRCLLLSGADPDMENKDGVKAEIMAFAQGNNETAELLYRMRPDRREVCIKQLIPTNQPLNRIKVKVFGQSGSGKTTLIDSLKCGFMGNLFRKVGLKGSSSNGTIRQKSLENGTSNTTSSGPVGTVPRQSSLPTQLSFDVAHEAYTRGIDIQQVTLTASGDLSLWEFSGYEPYYMMYDHFIGDPNCIHLVTFSLADSQEDQLAQLTYWLHFIRARIAPMEPIGFGGRHPWPPQVLIVATHADLARCSKNSNGEYESPEACLLLETMRQKFAPDFSFYPQVFVMDAHSAMSSEMKALRLALGEVKDRIAHSLPGSNGFLDATVQALPTWRRVLGGYPVVSWPKFIEYVRSKVNLLASEEHLKELMCQLQLVGEVIYVETENEEDLVVLNPKWLCSDVIGQLLSHDFLSNARPTGCFSTEEFQLLFPDTDIKDLLYLLEALEMCTRCELEEEVEYEFPCLNFVETLHGLWERDDTRLPGAIYGGVRFQCPKGVINQIMHLFPRIQVHLRGDMIENNNGPECDLYQWYHGSKFCKGSMEGLVTLEQKEQVLEVKVRGSEACRSALYYFLEELCDIVLDVIEDACPGINLEKQVLSPCQLKAHKKLPGAYSSKDLLSMQLRNEDTIRLSDAEPEEKFMDLICFGAQEIARNVTLGVDLHISHLSLHLRRSLSHLLDPADHMGRDWCLLAVALGLTDDLPKLDQNHPQAVSKTDGMLALWSRDPKATIRRLVAKLEELGRQDAMDAVLSQGPLCHVFQDAQAQESDDAESHPTPHSSDNTIASSVSR